MIVLEKIVVTARNRAELANKITIALSSFTAAEMEKELIQDVGEIIAKTPGLSYDSFGSMATGSPVIRGLGQPGLVGDETNVAVFIDGIYASGRDAAFFPLNGIERVEVVKGPQSALYGRNAFAGAINYITKKPSEEFVGGLNLTAGQFGKSEASFYASGGLGSDFRVRMDGSTGETGGTFNDPDEGYEMGSIRTDFGRIRMMYNPLDWFQADMSFTKIDMEQTARPTTELIHNAGISLDVPRILIPFQDAIPDPTDSAHDFFPNPEGKWLVTNPKQVESNPKRYIGKVNSFNPDGAPADARGTLRDINRINISLKFDLENYTIDYLFGKNETNYSVVTGQSVLHTGMTFVPMPIPGFIPFTDRDGDGRHDPQVVPVTGIDIGGQPNDDRAESSHELRISGGDEAWIWSFGGFYSDLDLTQWMWNSVVEPDDPLSAAVIEFMGLGLEDGLPRRLISTDYTTETQSLFFSIGHDITYDWNVTLEGRWTSEDKTADNNVDLRAPGFLFPTGYQEGSWSYFTPRLTVDYDVDPDTLLYLNIGNGIKSGGINGGASEAESTFEPEENWTYELGIKTLLMEERLRLNFGMYYVDWTDQQIRDFSTVSAPGSLPGIIISNLGQTEVVGFELDTRFRFSESLAMGLAVNFSDNEITEGRLGPEFGYLDFADLGMGAEDFPTARCVPIAGFDPACVNLPGPNTKVSDGDVSGNQLPRTSKVTANFDLDYNTELQQYGFYTRWSVGYRSKQYMDSINQLEIGSRIDSKLVIGLEAQEWRASFWVNNLFDEDTPLTAYRKFLFNAEPQTVMEPANGRTAGITFAYQL